ncbi:uncharacterized protein EV154DRAFT_223602 [Mucor mucedo]|uniref:uncharacterized protein n=1 Tax=Mucor mucedo TaxID=29922 RepID=UPI00221FA2E1|nr:uncharacterized protein EV154DRAFT_223602 [Mucor mucedo]KAI7891398.1 hypothetical protein EV154DRAFT_223602 [Mucor mucedo]
MKEKQRKTSLLYYSDTGIVIATGDLADALIKKFKKYQEYLVYVPNIFMELHNIYWRSQQDSYERKAQDKTILEEVIKVLMEEVDYWKEKSNCTNMDFYYEFTLPTNWDYRIREELIQDLFIKAGLIDEYRNCGRLVFFTELESTFRYIQSTINPIKNEGIQPGRQYVICSLDFQNRMNVDLELVTAQYPALTAINSRSVPQLSKKAHFEIAIELEELRLSLIARLKGHSNIILAPEVIDMMLTKLNLVEEDIEHGRPSSISYEISSHRPFYDLADLFEKQYGLKKIEIEAIRLITVEDIYENLSSPAETEFKNQMNNLFQDMGNKKIRSMVIFYTDRISENSNTYGLLKLIEKWSKTYGEEQENSYKLIENNGTFSFPIHRFFTREYGIAKLIKEQLHEFNTHRDPIILPKDTETGQSESLLKPTYFISIDMLPTKIKTTITYLDENRQTKQTETFESGLKSLDSFIVRSELYQRPMLHITNRLKRHLDNMFGSYLAMYSNSERQSNPVSKLLNRILQKMQSGITLSNYLRIKTSADWPKEIRNILLPRIRTYLSSLQKTSKWTIFSYRGMNLVEKTAIYSLPAIQVTSFF